MQNKICKTCGYWCTCQETFNFSPDVGICLQPSGARQNSHKTIGYINKTIPLNTAQGGQKIREFNSRQTPVLNHSLVTGKNFGCINHSQNKTPY